ncbi:hypothetical protein AHiyo6_31300 [Arthrobacter sp. Hiyo6]|jgi:hypothetical protein|nr:hypothetical protein AHiyo6_31300 [Arthrobacter sp. Hiyo6]
MLAVAGRAPGFLPYVDALGYGPKSLLGLLSARLVCREVHGGT